MTAITPADDPELRLSFDPLTIEHLGFKMYSRLPNAVAELVANAYDADANHVDVVVDPSGSQSVRVRDDGHGMSSDDLAEKYLRIGRNRRADDHGFSESGRRRVAGRKGLGKLALFGIGKRITIRTKRAGSDTWTVVTMNWDDIRISTGSDYYPTAGIEPAPRDQHGTEILVEDLKRKTPVEPGELAASLSQLFNYDDEDFGVSVIGPDNQPINVDRELRYASITEEDRWEIPGDLAGADRAPSIKGVIITTKRPLRNDHLRGVTVYVKGRLANDPEFFGVPESSHAYSYITGYIEADYLDDIEEDVVATDRRSINWDNDEAATLRAYLEKALREVARLRRETRRKAKEKELKDLGVDIGEWTGTIRDEAAAGSVRDVLSLAMSSDTEMSDDDRQRLVDGMRAIAPEYADLHWRSLHHSVQGASETLYKTGHYFHAIVDAIKRYAKDVRTAGALTVQELDALGMAFASKGDDAPIVDVAGPFLTRVSKQSTRNIREAQRAVSQGLWAGFRDPLAHEDHAQMQHEGIYTYQDCLDALSILSHLARRLETAATPGTNASSSG